MPSLSLVITDFALPGETDSRLPRLAALERLLARGRTERAQVESWRHWVLAEAGCVARGSLPIAATIADRAGHWALATPVHLLAGLERLHIDPSGLPRLSTDEQAALAASFNETFGADGLRLSFRDGEGLLALPRALAASSHDPHTLLGRDAGAGMPGGDDGPWLRRLMTEIQMWLHAHPLNAEREARNEVPVNALWIWGHGGTPQPAAEAPLPRIHTGDAFLRRLWQRSGASVAPPADSLQAVLGGGHVAIATLELGRIASRPDQALERAEEVWFDPLDAALASGRLARVRLLLGGRVVTLGRFDRFRVWRSRRAWFEALG